MRIPIRFQLMVTYVALAAAVVGLGTRYVEENIRRRWELNFDNQFKQVQEWVSSDITLALNRLNDKISILITNEQFKRSLIEYLIARERDDGLREQILNTYLQEILPVSGLDFIAFYDQNDELTFAAGGRIPPSLAESGAGTSLSGAVTGLEKISRSGRTITHFTDDNQDRIFAMTTVPVSIGDRFAGSLSGGINLEGMLLSLERNRGIKCHIMENPATIDDSLAVITTEIPELVIGVEKDYAGLQRELAITRRNLVEAGILILIFAVPLIFFLSGRMSRRIKRLSISAAEIGTGKRDVSIRVSGSDEITDLAASMRNMMDEIIRFEESLRSSERVAAWRDVARGIAHEVRNLLSPIELEIGKIKKVQSGEYAVADRDQHVNRSLRIIEEASYDISRMIQSFSEFAKLPAPDLKTVNLVEILEESIGMLDRDQSGCVQKRYAAQKIVIEADRAQLKRCFYNILKNAVEALDKPKPQITVSLAVQRHYGTVTITDNGIGMDDDTLQNIFSPYFTKKPGGTGLGLVLTDHIIRSHNGHISVESRPGEGTSFSVRIPCAGIK